MTDDSQHRLPVHACLPEIVSAARDATPVVLKAPPGAGKTTGVPPALLDSGAAGQGQVLLVQPRRLAARAAASRLARALGCSVGQRVGYHVRFNRQTSRDTTLIAMTTGVLLRRLHDDPLLENVSCVILDEFHERSVEIDLALGMLQRIRNSLRPELRLVVMSATLDPQPILDFLGDGLAVVSEGKSFEVDIQYTDQISRESIDRQIAAALPKMLSATSGDVLVFLPGVGEIRATRRAVESLAVSSDCNVMELYGDLPPKEQDAVLGLSNRRKIILSTNVAETSVTIPGVTAVIDSGLARVMRYESQVGLPKLQVEPISQASADQRAGRAGRTQRGVCLRLWPAAMHRSRRERDTPEIQRCDFSGPLLTLTAWGEREVFAFPWLMPPRADAVDAARQLLERLDAIGGDGSLTRLGARMLPLPLHPRLARFMLEAAELGIAEDASLAAALLTERDPFRGPQGSSDRSEHLSGCDITQRVDRMHRFLAGDRTAVANEAAAKQVKRVADQVLRMARSLDASTRDVPEKNRMKRALLAAYPDRVARRRSPGDDRGLMVGGRGVRLDRRSCVKSAEFFVCVDVDATRPEATVRAASETDPAWFDPRLTDEVEEPFFDAELKSVVVRRRRLFADLLLDESPIQCRPSPLAAAILANAARSDLNQVLPEKNKEILGFIERVGFLTQQMPELGLPPLDDIAIGQVLDELCKSQTSFRGLRSASWLDQLRARYDYEQTQTIEKHAPSRLTVPSGNSISIDYCKGKPPVMQVRIQELFGWKSTPRLAGGKVALQLHLLGPNYRPQQITEDLENFWNDTYQQVRKELRRRYPKHHWPEDPTTARATRNGLKPKS